MWLSIGRSFRIAAVCGAIALLPGCGGGEKFETASVSGKVTMDGKPLANAKISFTPTSSEKDIVGSGSFGQTNENGEFTLEVMTTGEAGAVVGKHKVTIVTPEPESAQIDDAFEFVDPIPARYNRKSTLTFDVPSGGSEEANFDLTSQKDELDQQ